MSKYLKWYDFYLDHTPTEDLAKNELESAHRKIKQLTESLAKANERVAELELIVVAITHADETGYVDDVGFVENWSQVCDETKALLNKFAIEKKIEAINAVLDLGKLYTIGEVDHWAIDDAKVERFIEQLRKEQE